MGRSGGLCGALLLVAAVVVSAPGRAEDIPFIRTVIAPDGPDCPCGKALGDLDGNGRPDVIVAGSDGPLLWYADPDWTPSVMAAQGYTTEGGLAVGDLDRDGDPDVTVGTVWFENPRRPGGNPAAGPWPAHRIGPGSGNRDVAVGDLDRDGRPDVVLRGGDGSVLTLFKQNGPRSWLRRNLAPGVGTQGLALADLNRDGFLDVVVGGRWLKNPRGRILSRPWQRQSFGSWNPAAALAVGDLNRDGRPDVVMTVAEGAGRISWFENPANPGRSSRWRERVIDRGPLDSAEGVSLADLDGNGDLDVVTSEIRGEGRLLVYRNAGQASGWSRQVLGTPALHDVRVSDVGDDGDGDVVGTLPFGKGPVELWENRLEPQTRPDRILVFSRTVGFRHTSIEPGIAALRALGAANRFAVDATEDAGQFTAANLGRYKAVVFLSTTGDVLNGEQQAVFMAYIRNGGGFVGIHAAADTEHGWPWYGNLLGAYFVSHPAPAQARIRVETRDHPSTRTLPDPWNRFDEWYDFERNPRSQGVTVLLTLDETSYPGGQMGSDHPIAWYHGFEGGRAWYTAGGHTDASFSEPAFLEHLLGGIRYAAGISE
ncbi:MAG TPA: ThuA domain-containing protein [Thermoanaerobaculia bacterium]|nr:ThuA domain-containing protein [Thermoanaerobaculia bacterium]